tara:strand:+ start:1971 stop:2270 length:300 start_codon:yes stop_codon:yes gene_type:complete
MTRKIENLKDLEIWTDLEFIASIIKQSVDKKETKINTQMADAIGRLFFYFHESRNNVRLYKEAVSDYRLKKNRAVERARKAEKSNDELRKSVKKLQLFA